MVPGDTTRPVTDMVKTALFNILGEDVFDSSWLDLFGGTGSIGLEALSRGAAFCRFIDLNRAPVETIKANLELTRLKALGQVIQADALAYLNRPADRVFDYIYIAPPQYKELWIRAMERLDSQPGWFGPETEVIVQIDPLEYQKLNLTRLVEFETRKYGNTQLIFYKTPEEPDPES